jgi:hypothetical protein
VEARCFVPPHAVTNSATASSDRTMPGNRAMAGTVGG